MHAMPLADGRIGLAAMSSRHIVHCNPTPIVVVARLAGVRCLCGNGTGPPSDLSPPRCLGRYQAGMQIFGNSKTTFLILIMMAFYVRLRIFDEKRSATRRARRGAGRGGAS